jgi:hypothetical protein
MLPALVLGAALSLGQTGPSSQETALTPANFIGNYVGRYTDFGDTSAPVGKVAFLAEPEKIPAPVEPAKPAEKEPPANGACNGNGPKKQEPPLEGCLARRLFTLYWRDIVKLQGPLEKQENGENAGNGEEEEEEKPRRAGILPPPWAGTPFPSEEFLMVHPIGVDLEETWPLMKAIYAGPCGDAIKASRIKLYGWIDFSANVSTSQESNLPDAFNIRANKIELDQAFVRLERLCDTVQQDHMDWGFRLDNFFGIDYRYTTAKGIFSSQFIKHNRLYGDDPIMFYGELYFPNIGQGTLLKAGRFILLPGIEADTTIDNYMFSHSVLYTYFPYTHTGILATTMINKNWTVQYGFVAGSDIALWADGREGTFITGVRWVSNSNKDSIYACTITNSGNQTYNNVQMMPDVVWTHVFSKRVHMLTETYYNYMKNVPQYTVFTSPDGTTETNQGWTVWYGVQNYFEVALTKKSYVTLRTDFMHDVMGQRTGFKTPYLTEALGYVYKPYSWLWYRPEIRWSHSFDTTSYNQIDGHNITGSVNGTAHNQVTVTFDALFRF